jgi:hypothetical protein
LGCYSKGINNKKGGNTMSYQRWGYPLEYFKTGDSKSYVFVHCGDLENNIKDYVEDYDDEYKDNKSLIELIGRFIVHETKDEKYAWKMVKILAKKLRVEKDLREKPLNDNEFFDLVLGGKKNEMSQGRRKTSH